MLNIQENVSVFSNAKEYGGIVLGMECDEFWLWVPDLDQVHRGHVGNMHRLADGKKFLSAAEWISNANSIFDSRGEFSSDIFWGVKNPQPMIDLLKTYRLIGR